MALNHTDYSHTGVTTRRTKKMLLYLFDFHLETCALLLKEACHTTKEALYEQGTALKENLKLSRQTAYRLEISGPDLILVTEYHYKKKDMAI